MVGPWWDWNPRAGLGRNTRGEAAPPPWWRTELEGAWGQDVGPGERTEVALGEIPQVSRKGTRLQDPEGRARRPWVGPRAPGVVLGTRKLVLAPGGGLQDAGGRA